MKKIISAALALLVAASSVAVCGISTVADECTTAKSEVVPAQNDSVNCEYIPEAAVSPVAADENAEPVILEKYTAPVFYSNPDAESEITEGDCEIEDEEGYVIEPSYASPETSLSISKMYVDFEHNLDIACVVPKSLYSAGYTDLYVSFNKNGELTNVSTYVDKGDSIVFYYTVSDKDRPYIYKTELRANLYGVYDRVSYVSSSYRYVVSGNVKFDADGNGKIEKADSDKLLEYLIDKNVVLNAAFDVVNDGVVDVRDYVALQVLLESKQKKKDVELPDDKF